LQVIDKKLDIMNYRVIGIVLTVFLNFNLFSQGAENTNVTKSNTYYSNYIKSVSVRNIDTLQLLKARNYINDALKSNISNQNAKTWFVKGNIELALVNAEGFKSSFKNATNETIRAYKKCLNLDAARSYTSDAIQNLKALTSYLYSIGTEKYNKKLYEEAYANFSKIIEVNALIDSKKPKNENSFIPQEKIVDMPTIEAAAYSALNSGKQREALRFFEVLYANNSRSYGNLKNYALLLKNDKQTDKFNSVMLEAKKLFPDIKNILIDDIIALMNSGNINEAISKAKEALDTEPNNEKLYFTLGNAFERNGDLENASLAYETAIKKNANYFDANYNLGVIYYNKAIEKIKNLLDNDARTNSFTEKIKKEVASLYIKALPFFEKANFLKPNDQNTKLALKEIYTKLGKTEKLKSLK